MEFNSQGINQLPSQRIPQPSNCGFLTERDLGQTQHEFSRDHHHPHLHPFHHPPPPPYPHNMHAAIQIELDKEKIRQEIIVSEIARRRSFENEVRREMMMKRQFAMQRGDDGFPFGLSRQIEFDSSVRLPLLGTRADVRSLEERTAITPEELRRLNGRCKSGGFDTMQFQRGTADLSISESKPLSEGSKEKQEITSRQHVRFGRLLMRKAETPPGVDACKLASSGIMKKKAKGKWNCALCQVNASSERILKEHLRGKKHTSKEAALIAERATKSIQA